MSDIHRPQTKSTTPPPDIMSDTTATVDTELSTTCIRDAAVRIASHTRRTPLLAGNAVLDELAGCQLHFKTENLQQTGSFKVGRLAESGDATGGVVTHSSGNHGAALAYAARVFGLGCTVVAPDNAPAAKLQAIERQGAKLVRCRPTMADRVSTCERVTAETGAKVIHSQDNWHVMCGQATIGLELLEDVPDLDAIVVPTGGGGMAGGIAACVAGVNPACQVDDFPVADGMRVGGLGARCFETLQAHANRQVFHVDDAEILRAMRLVMDNLKLVIEPSAATAVAATLQPEFRQLGYKKVAVILCGGNVDLDRLMWTN